MIGIVINVCKIHAFSISIHFVNPKATVLRMTFEKIQLVLKLQKKIKRLLYSENFMNVFCFFLSLKLNIGHGIAGA